MLKLLSLASLAILYAQSSVINTNTLSGSGNAIVEGKRNNVNGKYNAI